jgi:hypothetical protein
MQIQIDHSFSYIKIFLSSLCIFFLLTAVLSFMLFLIGNYQEFILRSQFLLLAVVKISSLMCLISGCAYCIYLLSAAIRRKKVKHRSFFLGLLSIILGSGLLGIVHFVLIITFPVE